MEGRTPGQIRHGSAAHLTRSTLHRCLPWVQHSFPRYPLPPKPSDGQARPIRFLAHTPTEWLGTWNFGGYSSARIDELLSPIQQEIDPDARNALLDEVAPVVAAAGHA